MSVDSKTKGMKRTSVFNWIRVDFGGLKRLAHYISDRRDRDQHREERNKKFQDTPAVEKKENRT